jgi:hypothetical protein
MKKYEVGTRVEIIDAGVGARGCNHTEGTITLNRSTNGLFKENPGFNIELDNGEVWRVSYDGVYKVLVKAKTPVQTHIHISEPYTFNCRVTDGSGELIQTQIIRGGDHSYKVIYNGDATIVILADGTKGIAKRDPEDKYDIQIGHDIAFNRARIKQLQKENKQLAKGIKKERRIEISSVKYGTHKF